MFQIPYKVLSEVGQEIARAKEQWGTEFDDKNTLNDWVTYANIYLGKAASMGASPEEVKRGLRKAAGLIINALDRIESGVGFAPRHYDGQLKPVSLPEINEEFEEPNFSARS